MTKSNDTYSFHPCLSNAATVCVMCAHHCFNTQPERSDCLEGVFIECPRETEPEARKTLRRATSRNNVNTATHLFIRLLLAKLADVVPLTKQIRLLHLQCLHAMPIQLKDQSHNTAHIWERQTNNQVQREHHKHKSRLHNTIGPLQTSTRHRQPDMPHTHAHKQTFHEQICNENYAAKQ